MTTTVKVLVGAAVVGLLGVIVYAYSRYTATPTVTATGTDLPPVLTPTTGPTAPRARSTGSGGARDVPTTTSTKSSSSSSSSSSGHQNN